MKVVLTKEQTAGLYDATRSDTLKLALLYAKTHKHMPYVQTAVKILNPAIEENAVLMDELVPEWKSSGHQLHVGCSTIHVPLNLKHIHFLSGKFSSVYKLPETWSRLDIPKENFYQFLIFHQEPQNNLLTHTLLPGASLVFPVQENPTNHLQNIWNVLHCFEHVTMCKPRRMSLLNPTKYIVARNFKREVPDEIGVYSLNWAYSVIAANAQFVKYQEMFLDKALYLSNILRFRYPDTQTLQTAFDQFTKRQNTQKTLKKTT